MMKWEYLNTMVTQIAHNGTLQAVSVCVCVDYHIDRITEACVMNEGLKSSTIPTIYLRV